MKRKILAASVSLLMSSTVMAQGYQVDELSVRRLGDAFSGGAASANDASTAHYNPAGLTHLNKTEIVAGVTRLNNKATFDGMGVVADPADTSGSGLGYSLTSGGSDATSDTSSLIPDLYVAIPLNDKTVAGVTVNTPFASSTDYPAGGPNRYQSVKSSVEDIRLGLSVGYRLDPQLSVGASLLVDRMSGEIENAIPSAALCSVAEALTASPGLCAGAGFAAAGTSQDDGKVKMSSDDVAFGYALGLLWDLDDSNRLGVAYKSKVSHKLEGKAEFSLPANAEAVLSGLDPMLSNHTEDATLRLTTPASFSVSGFHQCNDALSLQADVTWTQWSEFKSLTIDGASSNIIDQKQDWKNNWRVAVGGDYKVSSDWTVRGGLAWDQSPVKKENRSLSFPLDDYRAISFGASYVMSPALTLDLATQKTLNFESDISEGDLNNDGSMVSGKVKSSSWSVAMGIRWRP